MNDRGNLRRLTDEEREAAYWVHHPECYTFDENGNLHFKPNASWRVVRSFLLMHQLEARSGSEPRADNADKIPEYPSPQSSADEVFAYIAARWAGEDEPMGYLADSLKDCEGKDEQARKKEALGLLCALSLYW